MKDKYFSQQDVDRYCKLKAQIDRLEGERVALREKIIGDFRAKLECPVAGPYLLVYRSVPRDQISWKDELADLFRRIARRYPDIKGELLDRWGRGVKSIKTDAPSKRVRSLDVAINPDWDGRVDPMKLGV